jgi:hypothetical protein
MEQKNSGYPWARTSVMPNVTWTCDCDGLADDMLTPRHCCTGHVTGCTCDVDWDEIAERRLFG